MKKTVTILLSLIFIANLVGFYVAMPIAKLGISAMVHAGFESGILKKKLVTLRIPLAETQKPGSAFRKTDDDEFAYKGMMYDIASSETKNDSICFHCYSDVDEDNLMASLDEHIHYDIGINDHDKKSGHETARHLKEYLNGKAIPLKIRAFYLTSGYYEISEHYTGTAPAIHTPPPRQA